MASRGQYKPTLMKKRYNEDKLYQAVKWISQDLIKPLAPRFREQHCPHRGDRHIIHVHGSSNRSSNSNNNNVVTFAS